MLTREKIQSARVVDLRALCRILELPVSSVMKKADMVNYIAENVELSPPKLPEEIVGYIISFLVGTVDFTNAITINKRIVEWSTLVISRHKTMRACMRLSSAWKSHEWMDHYCESQEIPFTRSMYQAYVVKHPIEILDERVPDKIRRDIDILKAVLFQKTSKIYRHLPQPVPYEASLVAVRHNAFILTLINEEELTEDLLIAGVVQNQEAIRKYKTLYEPYLLKEDFRAKLLVSKPGIHLKYPTYFE